MEIVIKALALIFLPFILFFTAAFIGAFRRTLEHPEKNMGQKLSEALDEGVTAGMVSTVLVLALTILLEYTATPLEDKTFKATEVRHNPDKSIDTTRIEIFDIQELTEDK